MKKYSALLLILLCQVCFAGDTHQDDEPHRIVYNIIDSSGKPVSGQTVNLTVQRAKDNYLLDFSDNTFKASGWTTKMVSMTYDATGEHYYRIITIDQAVNITGDYVAIVSNDNTTYADHQVETWTVSDLNKLIKIHR